MADALLTLKRTRPEWLPWLGVMEQVMSEAAADGWDRDVPAAIAAQHDGVPLMAGAAVTLEARSVRLWFERLVRMAASDATSTLATLHQALRSDVDVLRLFHASVCRDDSHVRDAAVSVGVDAEALQAVVALLPVPFLQACHRRWASQVPTNWVEGYCPICGCWPAFAEMRGIERRRYFRCGRCGVAWAAPALQCPYCRVKNHDELFELVPQKGASNGVICACARCDGFVKTLTVLQGCSPATVMLEDLATVDLDVAAIERGCVRPSGLGYPLTLSITEKVRH